jgi:hypothetical protein
MIINIRYGEDGKPICDAFVIGVAGILPLRLWLTLAICLICGQADLLAARSVNVPHSERHKYILLSYHH